jgi:hypothetical protein
MLMWLYGWMLIDVVTPTSEGGQSEVQILPLDGFIVGNLYCRALANSFVKTEVVIDLLREGQILSQFVSITDTSCKLVTQNQKPLGTLRL